MVSLRYAWPVKAIHRLEDSGGRLITGWPVLPSGFGQKFRQKRCRNKFTLFPPKVLILAGQISLIRPGLEGDYSPFSQSGFANTQRKAMCVRDNPQLHGRTKNEGSIEIYGFRYIFNFKPIQKVFVWQASAIPA